MICDFLYLIIVKSFYKFYNDFHYSRISTKWNNKIFCHNCFGIKILTLIFLNHKKINVYIKDVWLFNLKYICSCMCVYVCVCLSVCDMCVCVWMYFIVFIKFTNITNQTNIVLQWAKAEKKINIINVESFIRQLHFFYLSFYYKEKLYTKLYLVYFPQGS